MSDTWAIVLAAGEGSRLGSIATDPQGRRVPKQFCSLRGGPSLLGESLRRARAVADAERLVAIVASEHRALWEGRLEALPAHNVVVQPGNRGTAVGLLLPLLSVLERDPLARVVVLPCDHHVRREAVLARALRSAVRELEPDAVTLLGMAPDAPEAELGWIVPAPGRGATRRVAAFVEKPDDLGAERLRRAGALWNSFLLASRGSALLRLYELRLPGLVGALRDALARPPSARPAALAALYRELPSADFSRDVLQALPEHLRVALVPPCGWTDLGTPRRLAACLRTSPRRRPTASGEPPAALVLERALAAHRPVPRPAASA